MEQHRVRWETSVRYHTKMSSTLSARIATLGKDNFDMWKLQFETLLVKNDTWEYVSGEKGRLTVTTNEVIFVSREKSDSDSLNLASNATAKVEGKATVRVNVSCKSVLSVVKLENTLHVPDICSDLMSVSKITDKGFEFLPTGFSRRPRKDF